jgi:hypothetical protein
MLSRQVCRVLSLAWLARFVGLGGVLGSFAGLSSCQCLFSGITAGGSALVFLGSQIAPLIIATTFSEPRQFSDRLRGVTFPRGIRQAALPGDVPSYLRQWWLAPLVGIGFGIAVALASLLAT